LGGLFDIIGPHDDLDRLLLGGDPRVFLSDWNGAHPFVADFLGPLATTPYPEWGDLSRYSEMQYDEELSGRIVEFHRLRGETAYRVGNVVPGAGSAAFLATVSIWLSERLGGEGLWYLPPLYYNLAWWLRRLGCAVRPVARGHALDAALVLDLPRQRSVLLLTDPLWYVGRRVPASVLEQIRAWQESTGSLVFVDGTFQYLGWDDQPDELSAMLPVELTIRLVCPTKSLGLHGCRFAYLLAPGNLHADLSQLHGNLHGPASLADCAFGHRAMLVLSSEPANAALLGFVRANYHRLATSGALLDHLEPETGYFVFGRPAADPGSYLAMSQEFYELTGYPGYVRINLAKPEVVSFLLQKSGRLRR
jgi:aspartate/methionine/tyrosine aminotransferase